MTPRLPVPRYLIDEIVLVDFVGQPSRPGEGQRRQNLRLKARTLASANARRRGNSGTLSGSPSLLASFKI